MIHHVQRLGEPQLSGLYLKSFYNTSKRYRLPLPDDIRGDNTKFCGNCGCVRVAGYNLTMSFYTETEDEGMVIQKLKYTCHHCQEDHVFEVDKTENKAASSSREASPKVEIQWPKRSSLEDVEKVKKNITAKERAKKRKQSTLSNLLASKKGKEESKKNTVSLSLMDFMK
ncbi:unnamed protein product [Kluyveromyces dobzhanskii CBS 2104]|uniref:WGS project CCBQ000000000 data, contig 00107 n=1 Tax=Kluyveromyces dobzhanskii CBS 2104 TaxID=1427455 RepID=A0A0A8L146_9SACH|nr:unnamed protein product [Kluyveromyces dobzhanskii CBS 2104]